MKPRLQLRLRGSMWTGTLPCGREVDCGLLVVTNHEIAMRQLKEAYCKCLMAEAANREAPCLIAQRRSTK